MKKEKKHDLSKLLKKAKSLHPNDAAILVVIIVTIVGTITIGPCMYHLEKYREKQTITFFEKRIIPEDIENLPEEYINVSIKKNTVVLPKKEFKEGIFYLTNPGKKLKLRGEIKLTDGKAHYSARMIDLRTIK